jgi:hypothetical protein
LIYPRDAAALRRPFVILVPIPGTVRDSEYRFSADQVYDFLKRVG